MSITVNAPEEQLDASLAHLAAKVPTGRVSNPIADYFDTTGRLKLKILGATESSDSELLGLLVVGVVSSAEFYFRSILGRIVQICPLCERNAEVLQVPLGAYEFYRHSNYGFALGALEHVSLADADNVRKWVKSISGFDVKEDSSADATLCGYQSLCGLRHSLVHSRGFIGLKGSRDLGLADRQISKVNLNQSVALESLKLSHNAVRAVNRFLFNRMLSRWVEKGIFRGVWSTDKKLFTAAWDSFVVSGEDGFSGDIRSAYAVVRKPVARRRLAVSTTP
jgi:hypothetical protein